MAETNDPNSAKQASENGAATTKAGSPEDSKLEEKLAEAQAQAEKFKNEFLYLRAEFDNFRRHTVKERSDYLKYGSERLIVQLLAVIDNFERALETKISSDNFSTYQKGVEMTAQELKALLKNFGVTEVSSVGLPFDPVYHEALGSEESKDVPAGNILRVFKKPYKLHDKLIRPGQVVISKPPAST